jgi:hypothetical protein
MTNHYKAHIINSNALVKLSYRNGKFLRFEKLTGNLTDDQFKKIGHIIPQTEEQISDFKQQFANKVTYEVFDAKKAPKEFVKLPFDSDEFATQWELWKTFRKKKHKFSFLNIASENRKLAELKNISKNNEKTAIKIIQQCIDNGWKGFFELRNDNNAPIAQYTGNR